MEDTFFSEVDRNEADRVSSLLQEDSLDIRKILKSKDISRSIINGNTGTLMSDVSLIPYALPFYRNIFSPVCFHCVNDRTKIDRYTSLIQRGFVFPILTSPYSEFPKSFREFVFSVPHINYYELKLLDLCEKTKDDNGEKTLCSGCAKPYLSSLYKRINSLSENKSIILSWTMDKFPTLTKMDATFIENMIKSMEMDRMETGLNYSSLAGHMHNVRISDALNSTLQLSLKDRARLGVPGTPKQSVDSLDMKSVVGNALFMNYSKDLPYERQLDLLSDNRERLTRLCKRVMDDVQGSQDSLSKLREELGSINSGILDLERSKTVKVYNLLTNFVDIPKTLLARFVSSKPESDLSANCGASLCSKKEKSFDLLDPLLEDFLSKYFRKDRTVIQTWLLRGRIKK